MVPVVPVAYRVCSRRVCRLCSAQRSRSTFLLSCATRAMCLPLTEMTPVPSRGRSEVPESTLPRGHVPPVTSGRRVEVASLTRRRGIGHGQHHLAGEDDLRSSLVSRPPILTEETDP